MPCLSNSFKIISLKLFNKFFKKFTQMFILSNYKKKLPFTVSKANNLAVIETSLDNLTFKAIESNSPVQFFCVKSCPAANSFNTKEFIEAKHFTIETIFEKPQIELENTTSSYLNLIADFGDKRSKEAVAKRGLRKFVPSDNITFNVENQLLPSFDKEATSPTKCYSLANLFEDELLESFESVESVMADSCLFVRTIYKEDKKLYMVILDCLHKVLNEKLVYARILGKYHFFYDFIKDGLFKNRLSYIQKDKLIVKFYIVALMACDFELVLDQIPRFGETLVKVSALLKMIGCSISRSGKVKLESMPQDTFTAKKFKKN